MAASTPKASIVKANVFVKSRFRYGKLIIALSSSATFIICAAARVEPDLCLLSVARTFSLLVLLFMWPLYHLLAHELPLPYNQTNMTELPLTLIIAAVLLGWNLILTWLVFTTRSHYHRLTKDTKSADLTTAMNNILKQEKLNYQANAVTAQELKTHVHHSRLHFQKLGFMRFNPFTDTGGDQSFVLSLLDETNSGFVISSLHSRENTRLYAKKIIKGEAPDQILSKEEKHILQEAIKSHAS